MFEWLIVVQILVSIQAAELPNIVFILADDLGWNDVSFHGSEQIPTPNIDALAYDGIILNNYYVQSSCSPTRASLLTGRYPMNTGMRDSQGDRGLCQNEKILPDFLNDIGYASHMIGKWHLGYSDESYTPTNHGFQSFYGFYSASIDYFEHIHWRNQNTAATRMHDLWRNNTEDRSGLGRYSTDLFTAEAVNIIENHNQNQPLFLYLAHQAPHVATGVDRIQAACSYFNRLEHVHDFERRIVAAMMVALDDSVGNITEALAEAGMLDNTIIIFSSDNGGHATNRPYSNWPLRGTKHTLFEGGTRVPAFLWSPLLEESGYVSNHMMHITDWLPTLMSSAGHTIDEQDGDMLDGFDLWDTLSLNEPDSPRTEMIYDISGSTAALRVNNLKLVTGRMSSGWYSDQSSRRDKSPPIELFDTEIPNILEASLGRQICSISAPVVTNCGRESANSCVPQNEPCLFDLSNDPCEYNNLANERPAVVRNMLNRLEDYESARSRCVT